MQKQEPLQPVTIEIAPAEDDDHFSADHRPHEVGSEQVKSDTKGLPTTRDLFSIWLINLFFGTQFMVMLQVYMVRNFGEGHYSEQKVAQLTGFLAGASSFSRTFTSMLWGKASDHTGRLAMITMGHVAIIVSILGFGASMDYTAALLWRLIPSAFISNSVAVRTLIGEAYSQEGQATALGVFNVGSSLGFVLGSILGGSLSQPCDLYQGFPLCGPQELLQIRPFLLPCIVTAGLGLFTIVCNLALLEETHPTVKNAPGGWLGHVLRLLVRLLTCTAFSKRAAGADGAPGAAAEGDEKDLLKEVAVVADLEMTAPSTASKQPGNSRSEQQGHGQPYMNGRSSSHGSAKTAGSLIADSEASPKQAILRGENGEAKDELAGEGRPLLQSEDSPRGSGDEQSDNNYRWWRDAAVLRNIIGSGLTTFCISLVSELTPIFVSASQDTGGLGLPLDRFTVAVTVGAVALIGYSLWALPRTTRRFGSLTVVKVGLLAMVPSTLSVPFSSLFANSTVVTQVMLSIAMIAKGITDTTVAASTMILLNMFAPRPSIGSINGAGQTLMNLGRALGPFLSGALWAGAVSLSFPGQQYLAFGVPVLGFLSCYWLIYSSLQMPPDA